MQYEIYYKPTYSLAEIHLSDRESIQLDRRSMAYMSTNFKVSTGIKGGVFRGFKRTVLGGGGIFLNTFVTEGDAIAGLTPPYVGDIVFREIKDETLLIQGDSFLAGSESLDLDTKWGAFEGFCRRPGFFSSKFLTLDTSFCQVSARFKNGRLTDVFVSIQVTLLDLPMALIGKLGLLEA